MKKLIEILKCYELYRTLNTSTKFKVFLKEYKDSRSNLLGIGNDLPLIMKHLNK